MECFLLEDVHAILSNSILSEMLMIGLHGLIRLQAVAQRRMVTYFGISTTLILLIFLKVRDGIESGDSSFRIKWNFLWWLCRNTILIRSRLSIRSVSLPITFPICNIDCWTLITYLFWLSICISLLESCWFKLWYEHDGVCPGLVVEQTWRGKRWGSH